MMIIDKNTISVTYFTGIDFRFPLPVISYQWSLGCYAMQNVSLNMFIGICSRSQVSVYRTIGPLVLIFVPKHRDCWYLLERPRLGGFNVYPQSMFRAKIRKISKIFLLKIFIFYIKKNSVYCMGKFSQ